MDFEGWRMEERDEEVENREVDGEREEQVDMEESWRVRVLNA